jgi:hypothetical protein
MLVVSERDEDVDDARRGRLRGEARWRGEAEQGNYKCGQSHGGPLCLSARIRAECHK